MVTVVLLGCFLFVCVFFLQQLGAQLLYEFLYCYIIELSSPSRPSSKETVSSSCVVFVVET